nr:polyprenyl synthetase family protein [Streptomyces clavuligerus]
MSAMAEPGSLAPSGAPDPDLPGIRTAVERTLDDFLDGKARDAERDDMPPEVIGTLRDFVLRGGKRLRPLLCACGWYAAGGTGDPTAVVRVGAALELFHAFALVHDDLMDRSATRRAARPSTAPSPTGTGAPATTRRRNASAWAPRSSSATSPASGPANSSTPPR